MMLVEHPVDRTPVGSDALLVIDHHRVRPELVVVLGQVRSLAPRGFFVCDYWEDGTRPRSGVVAMDTITGANEWFVGFVRGWLMSPSRTLPERARQGGVSMRAIV